MANKFEFSAELRTEVGRGASRRLRKTNKIPAIIYGDSQSAQMITVGAKEIMKALENEAVFSHILKLTVAGQTQQVILKDLNRHPFKPQILHIDFQRISASKEIVINVPLHFIGEEDCPGVKVEGGIATKHMIDAEISCLPANLPEFIELDLSELKLGQSVHLSDIKLPKGVSFPNLVAGTDQDKTVVSVQAPTKAVTAETLVTEIIPEEEEAETNEDSDK